MLQIRLLLIVAFLCSSSFGQAQEQPSIDTVLGQIKANNFSTGFSLRANVFQTLPNGKQKKIKISLVGQISPQMTRIWIKPVSGDYLESKQYFLMSRQDGLSIAVVTDDRMNNLNTSVVDITSQIADLGLYTSDMLGVWQQWEHHEWGVKEFLLNTSCLNLISSSPNISESSMHVSNCIDLKNRLILKSEIYDVQMHLIRSFTVEKIAIDSEGRSKPQKTITISGGLRTQISIYSADEEYIVSDETFKPLNQFLTMTKQ